MELELHCIPVLLDEIQLTVVFGVKIAQVAARLDMFLEQRLLQCEVRLRVENVATATAGLSVRTLGASTLNGEACLGPKPTLTDNVLHTFKPPQIVGVVIWEIE